MGLVAADKQIKISSKIQDFSDLSPFRKEEREDRKWRRVEPSTGTVEDVVETRWVDIILFEFLCSRRWVRGTRVPTTPGRPSGQEGELSSTQKTFGTEDGTSVIRNYVSRYFLEKNFYVRSFFT